MSNTVRQLAPQSVWNFFEDLNAVPRPSKKETAVVKWIMAFGEKLGLETICDDCVAPGLGNVVIKKPATKGMEDRPTIVLQSHLDMVHQKNNDTDFDFAKEGIQSYIDGEWVKAKGTTLGADNGMGVAASMAVLASTDIQHPAIEALFTIDEETGMTGAKHLANNLLKGDIMLNLDTEDDDELCIGCAGGIDTNVSLKYKEENCPVDLRGMVVEVKGLKGGHSGMDINLGLANANKVMNRLLFETHERFGTRISSIDGGGLRNAIPRESTAMVAVADTSGFERHIRDMAISIQAEYASVEPALEIVAKPGNLPAKVMPVDTQEKMLNSLYVLHNGVYRMSADFPDLVETSNSLARVLLQNGEFSAQCLTRSSVESSKHDLANSIKAAFTLMGAEIEQGGDYPGWQPLPEAPILKTMHQLYRDLFNEEPQIKACHAGLECGIIGTHYPKMHMISFGPTIKGPHSPDERVHIPSVEKFWRFLCNTLENIPHMKG